MESKSYHSFLLLIVGCFLSQALLFGNTNNLPDPYAEEFILAQDTFPITPRYDDYINGGSNNPFDLNDPKIVEQNVEYDPATGQYIITETIGDDFYRAPTYMSFSEYLEWRSEQQEREYFQQLAGISSGNRSESGRVDPISKVDVASSLLDRLFGGTAVDIRPEGSIDLTFGLDYQTVDNPILTERQRTQGGFDFDMNIQTNVTGQIGEKLKLSFNYNTQATFDFDNRMKLEYDGLAFSEDEIIKTIEAGNVSLPLNNSLIKGSQSLFGIKTELQFGRLFVTAIASQQKSKRDEIQIQGGSQLQTFEVPIDQYDENRHFFLSHYNRDNFEGALTNLPQVRSLFRIEEIEVWVTNTRNATQNIRDIVAIADLGESDGTKMGSNNPLLQPPVPTNYNGLPDNDANPIYQELINNPDARKLESAVSVLQSGPFNFQQVKDFEKVQARKLTPSEFTYHPELGFISVNVSLQPSDVLGVACKFKFNDGDKTYQIGELSTQVPNDTLSPNVLYVKMLKSTTARVDLPMWDLMMKNVYSTGAYQSNQRDFKLDIFYDDPGRGDKRFIPDQSSNLFGVPLLNIFNLDKLNVYGDPQPDGVFDYVPGVTIIPRTGKVIFPVLEPFGEFLREQLDPPHDSLYPYVELYDSTITLAREFPERNRFKLKGEYKSSVSSEISLGAFNIPRGSVTISAGSQQLREGVDYEVDYNIGRVKILNDAILSSGLPVRVSFEDNTLFGFQTKTLWGTRLEYRINDQFKIGGTFLNLFERPFTQKVNIGDDPINNKIYGLDLNLTKKAPWLTKMVDRIPLIDTKEESEITLQVEAAALDPGHARAINQEADKSGASYLDDFEGSTSPFDLRTPTTSWVLASIPKKDQGSTEFQEGEFTDSTISGVNRALINWYRIDGTVRQGNSSNMPYTREVTLQEIFPNLVTGNDLFNQVQPLDITYYPDRKGPYNFDPPAGTDYSNGFYVDNGDIRLNTPENRWGGVMRSLNTTDFQAANIEYIEFWMLNPFIENGGTGVGGNMVINLGNISEDILKDSRKFFENGLPGPNVNIRTEETNWSQIPITQQITNAFDNNPEVRDQQDVGLDGFTNAEEITKFSDYYSQLPNTLNPSYFDDPANDDFLYITDPFYDQTNASTLERYTRFNHPSGNSQTPPQGQTTRNSATNIPDSEDLDRDNTLNESESYFEYNIPLYSDNNSQIIWNQYVTDTITSRGPVNGVDQTWYRFKIPVDKFTGKVGGINDFRSIRFIRMYFKDFTQQTTFRFASFDLVRNQWRRYSRTADRTDIDDEFCLSKPQDLSQIGFDINAVNFERNANRRPFPYVLPPGINREQSTGTFQDALQNEQSLAMEVDNLFDGGARAIYKILNLDMRFFNRLRMFVHAEPKVESMTDVPDGATQIFMRLGSDFEENYYEYAIPLTMSNDPNAMPIEPEVWLEENSFDFPLSLLTQLKADRNGMSGVSITDRFERQDPEKPANLVSVKGNPNLGNVKSIMIGIKNPCGDEFVEPFDLEVWINELRVNGFQEEGGVAALARMDMKLADFGNLSTSVEYNGLGFGGLEDKIHQRSREEIIGFDVATNLELGKFLPEKSGIKVPFYAQYSNTTKNPEYDPYDLDIKLKDKLRAQTDQSKKDSIKNLAQDVTEIRSINFTNVRKERTNTDRKPMPWNIENFSVSYAYTQTKRRTPLIENDQIDRYTGELDYKYSLKPKYIRPFKKLIKKDKYLKFISDFNFNLVPNSFTFNTALDRQFNETKYRFSSPLPQFNTYYNKFFVWDRDYGLNWDLTKSLNIKFNALNESIIDEPAEFGTDGSRIEKSVRNDSIWTNVKDLGRTKNYNHDLSVSYKVPLKNFPFLDWINVKASYNATYGWNAAALNVDSLGNVIRNTQRRKIDGDLNFETLYNKSKYLKKINQGSRSKKKNTGRRNRRGSGNDSDSGDSGKSAGKTADSGGKGKSRNDRTSKSSDKNASTNPSGAANSDGGNNTAANANGGKASKKKDKKKKNKDREITTLERVLIRPLLMVRRARLSYSEDFGTIIPGYIPDTRFFGLEDGFNAPGWDFVAGWQPNDAWFDRAIDKSNNFDNSFITDNYFQNQQVQQTYTQGIDGRLTVEPFKDFRIDIEANKTYRQDHTESIRDTLDDNFRDIVRVNPKDVGSFNISYFTLNTLFTNDINALFNEFEDARPAISRRLAELDGDMTPHIEDAGYFKGYGREQQNVIIPAFLAAYTGQDPNTVKLDVFKTTPKLNWKLSYNGLQKLPWFKEHFTNINLKHGYQSTLTINSYNTDLLYDRNAPTGGTNTNSFTQNYFTEFIIPNIVISERMNPLIGVDIKLKNSMSFKFDMKQERNLSLTFTENSLAESKSKEYVFGFGYTLKDVKIPYLTVNPKKKKRRKKKEDEEENNKKNGNSILNFGQRGTNQPVSNDLIFTFDFSLRDDITINHYLDRPEQIPTRGARTLSISPSIDYTINRRLRLRLFYDYRQTIPYTSASFPITNSQGGLTVTFNLN